MENKRILHESSLLLPFIVRVTYTEVGQPPTTACVWQHRVKFRGNDDLSERC